MMVVFMVTTLTYRGVLMITGMMKGSSFGEAGRVADDKQVCTTLSFPSFRREKAS